MAWHTDSWSHPVFLIGEQGKELAFRASPSLDWQMSDSQAWYVGKGNGFLELSSDSRQLLLYLLMLVTNRKGILLSLLGVRQTWVSLDELPSGAGKDLRQSWTFLGPACSDCSLTSGGQRE